jgi:hypothetical protein
MSNRSPSIDRHRNTSELCGSIVDRSRFDMVMGNKVALPRTRDNDFPGPESLTGLATWPEAKSFRVASTIQDMRRLR